MIADEDAGARNENEGRRWPGDPNERKVMTTVRNSRRGAAGQSPKSRPKCLKRAKVEDVVKKESSHRLKLRSKWQSVGAGVESLKVARLKNQVQDAAPV